MLIKENTTEWICPAKLWCRRSRDARSDTNLPDVVRAVRNRSAFTRATSVMTFNYRATGLMKFVCTRDWNYQRHTLVPRAISFFLSGYQHCAISLSTRLRTRSVLHLSRWDRLRNLSNDIASISSLPDCLNFNSTRLYSTCLPLNDTAIQLPHQPSKDNLRFFYRWIDFRTAMLYAAIQLPHQPSKDNLRFFYRWTHFATAILYRSGK